MPLPTSYEIFRYPSFFAAAINFVILIAIPFGFFNYFTNIVVVGLSLDSEISGRAPKRYLHSNRCTVRTVKSDLFPFGPQDEVANVMASNKIILFIYPLRRSIGKLD